MHFKGFLTGALIWQNWPVSMLIKSQNIVKNMRKLLNNVGNYLLNYWINAMKLVKFN